MGDKESYLPTQPRFEVFYHEVATVIWFEKSLVFKSQLKPACRAHKLKQIRKLELKKVHKDINRIGKQGQLPLNNSNRDRWLPRTVNSGCKLSVDHVNFQIQNLENSKVIQELQREKIENKKNRDNNRKITPTEPTFFFVFFFPIA